MLTVLAAAETQSGGGFSNGVVTLAYILTSLATAGGIVLGIRRYVLRQREQWTKEGATRAEQAQALVENNQRLTANTEAMAALSAKFDSFAATVHSELDNVKSELNGHGHRISQLERRQEIGKNPGA